YNTTFNSKDQSKNFTVRELFKVEYNPTNELRFEGAFNLSKSVGHRDIFRPAQHTLFDNVTDPTLRGDYRRSQSEAVNWGIDLTGSWNKQLEDHYLTANARMSVLENNSETYGNYVTGFPNDNMDNLLFGKKYNEKVTGDERTTRSIGWVAAGGYSYKYKYSFDFNIRLDGSSQFGKNNRWAPFWSTGLRWDLKKENFLKDVSFISDFILRGTYGTTGSQGFDPYQAHGYYTYSNLLLPYYSSDATGSEILAMHNESLKWQTTKSTNLALELGFFDQRFTARVEYYRKITDNMVANISLAPSLGFSSYPENLGKIENKGWEISLSAIPYKNTAKQAYCTITVNG
ncbi:TonB-dependent receptor, partial [Parabacteroides merdae]